MTEAKKLNFRNSKILNYRKICAIQALRLKEIERRLMEDTRRKKHDWERDVEKMRDTGASSERDRTAPDGGHASQETRLGAGRREDARRVSDAASV